MRFLFASYCFIVLICIASVFLHMALGGVLVLLPALPFLLREPMNYLGLTYDFSRLFEHRVNMAWGFLGYARDLFISPRGACLIVCICVVFCD